MNKKTLLLAFSSILALSGCTKTIVESANNQTMASFDNQSIKQVVNELIQLDIDTYHVYNQAAKNVKDKALKDLLLNFAAKHEGHVNALSKVVLDLGGHPPSFSRDFKGFLTSGYTAIKVAGGKQKTLEAMKTNELISKKYYDKALSITMPRNIKEVIKSNLEDEKDHLEAIFDMQQNQKVNR